MQTLIYLLKRGGFTIPVRQTKNMLYSTMSSFKSEGFYEVFVSFGFSWFWFCVKISSKKRKAEVDRHRKLDFFLSCCPASR